MEKIVVLYAGGKKGHKFEKAFGAASAFDMSLGWAQSVAGSLGTVVLTDKENLEFVEDAVRSNAVQAFSPEPSIIQKDRWTNALVARAIFEQCSSYSADFALFAWADTPFLSKALTKKIEETHTRYNAEYTFADGFCSGLAPEAVDKGAAAIIASLGETSQKAAGQKEAGRDALFSIMSGDINSFEIETVIADKDYRMLRYNFECATKAGLDVCRKLYDEALRQKISLESGEYDVYKVSDLAESMASIQQTLPGYYNIQISGRYNTSSLYCPYNALFKGRQSMDMDFDKFKRLVEKISDFSEEAVVGLSLFGEPSLNPRFADFASEVLRHPGLSLFVETDGLCITENDARRIADSAHTSGRVDFAVQIDAADSAMYERINGIGAENFQKAVSSVAMLSSIFPDHVYPQFTRMNENEEQLESFYRFWREKTSPSMGNVLIVKFDSCAGALKDEKPADLSPLERNVCWHIRRDMNILSDGTVPVCRTREAETVGNAFDERLEDIWLRVQNEVKRHIDRNYCKRCMDCDEYYTFNF